MEAAARGLRLAGGSLELLAAVCRLRQGEGTVEVSASDWTGSGSRLACSAGPVRFQLRVRPRAGVLVLTLTAEASEPLEAEAVGLVFAPRPGGGPPVWALHDGYQSWDRAGVAAFDAAPRSYWRVGVAGAGAGGLGLAAASARAYVTRFDPGRGELRWWQMAPAVGARSQPVWTAGAGSEFRSEPLRIAVAEDARDALDRALPRLARSAGPAPRGWLSWYHLGIWVDEEAVLANSRLLAETMGDVLDPAVVQIDDGWQLSYGDWLPNTKFSDLTALCREIVARGQVPGVWTAPFLVSAGSDLAGTAPEDWFLRNPATGERLVDPGHTVFGPMYVLDARVAGVRRHLARQFGSLRRHGFRHFKIDFLYAGAYGGVGALRRGLQAIRRGAGADAYLLACGAPLLPVAGIADGCRIGPDTCTPWLNLEIGEPQPTFFGDEVLNVIRNVAARQDLGPWFHTDPDVAVAGGTLTAAGARQLITAVAICGGLYFLSDDLRVLDAERLALAANPELARIAAGGPARPDWEPDQDGRPPSIWRREDGLLAVFNHTGTPVLREVPAPSGAAARDLWTGARLSPRDGRLQLEVHPGDVRLIRFDPS